MRGVCDVVYGGRHQQRGVRGGREQRVDRAQPARLNVRECESVPRATESAVCRVAHVQRRRRL